MYIRRRTSLSPLKEHSTLIDTTQLVDGEERYTVRDKLPAPVDEHGIPRPSIMLDGILGSMATAQYVWTGRLDMHHLANPKADYNVARTPQEGSLGGAYRGIGALKIELPRQMHNYAHAIFELPPRPNFDTMRQAVTEVGQAQRIQRVLGSYSVAPTPWHDERERRECIERVHDVLAQSEQPELGFMPPLETLAQMEIEELRAAMKAVLTIRRVPDLKIVHPAVIRPEYEQRVAA